MPEPRDLSMSGDDATPQVPVPVAYNASGRLFGEAEEAEVLDVLRSGTLTRWGGTKADALEQAWANQLGVRHAIAVSSGTAALHVALAGLDLEPGTEVITSPISDMGTVIAIVQAGLIPVFADVDPVTGMMTTQSAERRIGPATGVLLPVHLFGRFAPVNELSVLARRHGLTMVEDASQAHFSSLDGVFAGTVGRIGCFSLQQTKVVSCGEGGIVVTNDDKLAERMRLFQNKGWVRGSIEERAYPFVGLNYRIPELSAAVAGAQLRKAPEIIAQRRRSMSALLEATRGESGIRTSSLREGELVSWWALPVQLPELDDITVMRAIVAELNAGGIAFALGYIGESPLYMMEALQRKKAQGNSRVPWSLQSQEAEYRRGDCPAAEWFLTHTITMNWNEGIAEATARFIGRALVGAVARIHPGAPPANRRKPEGTVAQR